MKAKSLIVQRLSNPDDCPAVWVHGEHHYQRYQPLRWIGQPATCKFCGAEESRPRAWATVLVRNRSVRSER